MVARHLLVNSGSNGVNLFTRVGGELTPEQPDPGLYGTSQDPGPSLHPQHHNSAHSVLHALPPTHFLHYQWSMPFSYSSFDCFPDMDYGKEMPSFPPPYYMQAPAYILPHPPIQPVDYRRLLHPLVHVSKAPYQNANQTCRIYWPHAGRVQETVNSEVRTEPTEIDVGGYGEESPPVNLDYGRGSASNSPLSSRSSSQKQGSAEVQNNTLPSSNAKDTMVKRSSTNSTVKYGFKVLHPTETKTHQSCVRATLKTQKSWKDSVGQENISPCRNNDFYFWSVSSSDDIDPVCSSSQQEDVVKERHVFVPDILSWGGGTPQATMLKMADKQFENDHQLLLYETEVEDKSVYQNQTETRKDPVVTESSDNAHDDAEGNLSFKDSATLFKILKLRKGHEERKAESRRENKPVGLVGSIRHLPDRDKLLHSFYKSKGPRIWHPFKYSDMKKSNNGPAEGSCMMEYGPKKQKRNGNRRNGSK